jgi:hypothetical protein
MNCTGGARSPDRAAAPQVVLEVAVEGTRPQQRHWHRLSVKGKEGSAVLTAFSSSPGKEINEAHEEYILMRIILQKQTRRKDVLLTCLD